MSRRCFLMGHLTGLLLGIGLVLLIHPGRPPREPAPAARIVPVATQFSEGEWLVEPRRPGVLERHRLPLQERETTKNRRSFEFNGQTVYMIPLSQNELHRRR